MDNDLQSHAVPTRRYRLWEIWSLMTLWLCPGDVELPPDWTHHLRLIMNRVNRAKTFETQNVGSHLVGQLSNAITSW